MNPLQAQLKAQQSRNYAPQLNHQGRLNNSSVGSENDFFVLVNLTL